MPSRLPARAVRAPLRPPKQDNPEAHEPQGKQHPPDHSQAGSAGDDQDLLVGDGLDEYGRLLVLRIVLVIVRLVAGSPAVS